MPSNRPPLNEARYPIDLAAPQTLSVETAAQIIGISRAKAYTEAQKYIDSKGTEGIPAFRIGRNIRVPREPLLELVQAVPPRSNRCRKGHR